MKSVLMIAYSFPPEGNAGAFRPLRFVRHLPSLDWCPTVITAAKQIYERHDASLLTLVPSEIEVARVRNHDPWQSLQARRGRRMQERISKASSETLTEIRSAHNNVVRSFLRKAVQMAEAWCYYPDTTVGWIRPAVKASVRLCARKRPEVIWATAGPVSSFFVAQKVSRETGVPYVLDFRDAWTVIPTDFDLRRLKWLRRLDRRTMFRLLSGAQAVIFRYDTEAECFWRAYQGALDISRIHIIPNGYEGEIDDSIPPKGSKCNILYTGTLPDYRYDPLLRALCLLKQSAPDLASRLHVHFVGEGTDALHDDVVALGLGNIITASSPVSYNEILRLSQEAHALLALGRPRTMIGYELFAPAKLFGYLKTGRPIVGVLPSDEAKKILHRVGVSTVANVDSVTEVDAVLRRLLRAWEEGKLSSLIPDPEACQAYSAERQTIALVAALEGMPPSIPFIPGQTEIPPSLRDELSSGEWKLVQRELCTS